MLLRHVLVSLAFVLAAGSASVGADEPAIDLTRAVLLGAGEAQGPARMAIPMLAEEVGKRSHVFWDRVERWPAAGTPVFVVGRAEEVRRFAAEWNLPIPLGHAPVGREGYRIGVAPGPIVWVAGDDDRGVLYGVGRLLRALRIERNKVTLPSDFRAESAPRTPIRGIQLGYRPKTNSYDAWSVAQWEQYYRDLIVFGCNAVELIPPRSDDDADSPHFPLPPLRMMVEMSRLADKYGLDVWAWYPAMDPDYANPKTVEASLKEWGEVFRALPRLDAVFVPGGDPGHTKPDVLFALLEKLTENLRRYHPKAQMWMSPQSFTKPWMDEFLDLMRKEPQWLSGLVHGPQVRIDLPALRAAVPSRYPIRDYPDITHSRHCQYPVPDWDVAFAVTEGREVCNPRPEAMARIARRSRPHTIGSIVYSEGCHDDVNKIVWLGLGWNERTDVHEILKDYGRYFIGPELGDRFADGLLGLEKNWQGAVLDNEGIDAIYKAFWAMEKAARPSVLKNWRFQQALYRAYYDAYVRARVQHEAEMERTARDKLGEAATLGSLKAMDEAEAILDRSGDRSVGATLRTRLGELAEALFQSTGAQLSVPKYRAIGIERGANFDAIDGPINNAGWFKAQFAAVRKLDDEPARLTAIRTIVKREDPGPGGFYDDLGEPGRQPHLVQGLGPDRDPAFYESSLTGFGFRNPGPDPATPRAWRHHAESLYETPLTMRYADLDPKASYRVRVVYNRERIGLRVRLTADERFEVHGPLDRAHELLEFAVPREATSDGALTLGWSQDAGRGGSGRGCQVAEVWLLKVPAEDAKP